MAPLGILMPPEPLAALYLSHGLCPSLRGASVVPTAVVVMAMEMVITAAAASATRETSLLGGVVR